MTLFFKYTGKITVLSPLAHNSDESCGVDTKFRRIECFYQGQPIQVPVYSGNAFRGLLRRTMAGQFCNLIGLGQKSLSDKLYYTWFTGGSLTKGAAQSHIEVGKKRDIRTNIPFLSLLGSAIGNMVLEGKINVWMGTPIAKETQEMTGEASDRSVYEMTTEIFYTRKDDLEDPQDKKTQAQQMKYNIEVLRPGIVLHHGFILFNVNEVEAGCFAHGIKAMQSSNILGGKSGTGHGRVKMEYAPEWANEKPYLDYIEKNKKAILEYVKKMEASL